MDVVSRVTVGMLCWLAYIFCIRLCYTCVCCRVRSIHQVCSVFSAIDSFIYFSIIKFAAFISFGNYFLWDLMIDLLVWHLITCPYTCLVLNSRHSFLVICKVISAFFYSMKAMPIRAFYYQRYCTFTSERISNF